MLYEVDHATFAFMDGRGNYRWTCGSEEVHPDILTLNQYRVTIGGLNKTCKGTSITLGTIGIP
jgi:hypothetical protein